MVVGGHFVFHAGEHTEFAFDSHIMLVCIVNDLFGKSHVLLIGKMRAVDHHRREAAVDAALAQLERIAVVEVKGDLGIFPSEFFGVFNGALCHVAQQGGVGIVAGAFGNLKDNGGALLGCGLDDCLKLLHVVEVESGNSIAAFDGLFEHLAGVHQT